MVEGEYQSLKEIMANPFSVTRDVYDYAGDSEDALLRCNADKASARSVLK